MRIVNQHGTKSIDERNYVLSLHGETIYAEGGNKPVLLGTYDSAKVANDVFIDIHGQIAKGTPVYHMPQ